MTEEGPYALELSEHARASFKRLDRKVARRIGRKLRWLASNATTFQHQALTGEWKGYFRLHIGHYRALYRLEHENRLIVVELIGHRRDVYDK